MNNVNKTLYIPLFGKAYVSRKGIILEDRKAEAIWASEAFPIKGKSGSKWLAYYMGMRAAVFDRWLRGRMDADPSAVILHLGCGLDSRCLRVGTRGHLWFDVDFPDVIRERKRYYAENPEYKMLGADVRSSQWLAQVSGGNAIVVLEGISMYLTPRELVGMLKEIGDRFGSVRVLMDCYTEFAARASKYKNPIRDVGVTQVYGLDDPGILEASGLSFIKEHEITPAALVSELRGMEKGIFRWVYAGGIARKLYRLYEYRGGTEL